MANSRSARKRIRSSERKHVHNRGVRAAVRTKVAKARRALLDTGEGVDAEPDVRSAVRALDRAAEKGVIHRNNARRRKSRLASMAARLATTAGAAEGDLAAARATAAGGAKGRSVKSAARKPATKAPAKKAAPKAPAAKSATRTSTTSAKPRPTS